jgi:hypothetical protein
VIVIFANIMTGRLTLQTIDMPRTFVAFAFILTMIALIVWLIAAHTDWLTYE